MAGEEPVCWFLKARVRDMGSLLAVILVARNGRDAALAPPSTAVIRRKQPCALPADARLAEAATRQ